MKEQTNVQPMRQTTFLPMRQTTFLSMREDTVGDGHPAYQTYLAIAAKECCVKGVKITIK